MVKIMKFYLQKNINEKDFLELKEIIIKNKMKVHEFYHIPFSDEYPELDFTEPFFIYAASNVTDKVISAYNSFAGVFAHSEDINIRNFFTNTPEKMWSNPIFMGSLKDIPALEDKEYFLRPLIDNKWFAGTVLKYSDLVDWIIKLKNIDIDMNTEILIADILYPRKEYRMFYVKNEIVTTSQYRENMETFVKNGSPIECQNFALDFIEKNKDVLPNSFVIDVAQSEDKIGIIEINSINNSGFYGVDKELLIKSLAKVCINKNKNYHNLKM
jgi:hypothetical protein